MTGAYGILRCVSRCPMYIWSGSYSEATRSLQFRGGEDQSVRFIVLVQPKMKHSPAPTTLPSLLKLALHAVVSCPDRAN